MGTMVETDMDQFIRNHKLKVQQERNELDERVSYPAGPPITSPSTRKQWDRGRAAENIPAEESRRAQQQPTDRGLIGNDSVQEQKKRQLQIERQKEYNELINKKGPASRRRPRTPAHEGLPLGQYSEKKKALERERNEEMKAAMAKKQQVLKQEYEREVAEAQRLANEQGNTFEQQEYQNKHRQLEEEKKREYQEYLAEQQRAQRRDMPEGTGATLPVGEYTDTRKQQLYNERQKEYQEHQQQKQATERRRGLPPKPPTPNHFFKNLGQHDRQINALNEERKKEYNQKLTDNVYRGRGRTAANAQGNAGSLPIGGTGSAEIRKMKVRNDEYNEFLREKLQKDAHRLDHKKPPGRHSEPNSPRNRQTGWSTPTYEEILEQKRREEAIRRHAEEGVPGLRSFHSEGALNRLEDNLRARELDKEFERRKVRFDDERKFANGILEDDNWLNPERREEQYQNLTEPPPPPREPEMTAVRQPYNATLLVGHDETGSAKRRKQADYARELQFQMKEAQAARTREKRHGLPVNASGWIDPEKTSDRVKGIGGDQITSPRREYKANSVQPYHTKFLVDDSEGNDGYQPSTYTGAAPTRGILTNSGDGLQYSLGGTGVERGRRRERDLDILDPGITGLLQQRRAVGPVNPPQQLMYQPSTFVTAGAGGIGGPYSSIDEAYHYYGMKNPLDVGDVGGGVPALNLGGDFGGRRGSPTRVTFREPESPVTAVDKSNEDRAHRKRDRSKERISPYQFPSDDDNRSRSRQDTLSYGAELERQIAEKRMQKQLQREEQERYERRLEEDIKNYNPFGRSGGGAPVKDSSGNPIADLRSLQRGNLSDRQSPVRQVPPEGSPQPPAPRDDYIQPPPVQHNALGESTYARGGHGIFGPPKTDAEKTASDRYKEELRQQIEDKKRKSLQAKELERQEEERENKRLEEQRQRMQAEYEKEQREKKEREEETRRKNEELRKLAEDKKKESERKKREAEDARMREQQEQIEKEKQEKQNEQRTNSPPLPAHRRDRESPRPVSRGSRTSSRAQPSPRPGPSNTRPNSSDVLTQLASMRKQLQNERQRVENALENSKNEPDVFDPRMVQRPTQSNKLVFENAMNKNASLPPPRAQTSDMANARNIQQFNELKFKSDSDSRRAFRSMFPDAPVTNMTLEAQQDAMIRQQEEALRGMRERNPYDNSTSLGYGRHGNTSARSQLAANSAFIDVEGVNHFPDDFEDLPGVRNDSARARRRDRFSPRVPSVNGMGSQTSLDVDRIERKNAERLRRLHQQINTGDDVSVGDPDDILDRFMAKQRYNRPPSGQTLQDDTWLRPGSKAI